MATFDLKGPLTRKEKWDLRYLSMARNVASWSKDPSTQTGAVIVDKDNAIVSMGYNGFAPNVKDLKERYEDRYNTKYEIIIHCEENAIIFADRHRLKEATLYTWPFMSCCRCAAKVIQAGIRRIVTKEAEFVDATKANDPNRWEHKFVLAQTQFEEVGVRTDFYNKSYFMRRVVLESPYAGNVEKNVKYAKDCVKDCLSRGETPFASHLIYTQDGVLDDTIHEERQLGMKAGFEWRYGAEATVVYTDLGISKGMECGIKEAEEMGHKIEYRKLYAERQLIR